MIPKLDMQSPDGVQQNIEKLASLFPQCITETAEGKAIDFDLLKQELSHQVIEGNKERYRLEWPGKREAIVTANLPTSKTLRPIPEDSVDFDSTENIYIEGDNLEVLKLLQESYLGKIKMIYIDPPYNTGKDFVYKDNFTGDKEKELFESGQKDEYNQRLFQNPETAGRYHSDWLSMMYPRLKLARNLLTDDGVIFISIDDNEVHNLRKVCDEIFGEGNFVANVVWEKKFSPSNDAKWFSDNHDHILVFSKSKAIWRPILLERPQEALDRYKNPDNDERGIWVSGDMTVKTYSAQYDYEITTPSGKKINPPDGICWRFSKEKFGELIDDNRIWFGEKGENVPRIKRFLSEVKDGITPLTIWYHKDVGHNQEATQECRKLFDGKQYFDTPKPSRLLLRIVKLGLTSNDIILDFFSGSATTAHAVMQLNAEDGGKRKFILVQIPETTDETSEAYKAGYTNICEIGKERIRRAGKKICLKQDSQDLRMKQDSVTSKNIDKGVASLFDEPDINPVNQGNPTNPVSDNNQSNQENQTNHSLDNNPENQVNSENPDSDNNLDIGFRVYRLADSNMQNVYYRPQEFSQETLDLFADNVKPDRTALDLLTQVILDWGLPLSLKIEPLDILGKQVFSVAQNSLYACFDKGIDEAFAKAIATYKPMRIVFIDSGFANDSAKINVQQLLKQLSPNTEMKVV